MAAAKGSGLINSYYVFNAGDDLEPSFKKV